MSPVLMNLGEIAGLCLGVVLFIGFLVEVLGE